MRLSIFLILVANLIAQKPDRSAIVYGKNLAYSIQAPKGWVVDVRSGLNQGLPAVIYEAGSNWLTTSTRMYTNVAHLTDETPNLQSVIDFDIKQFKTRSKNIIIEQQSDIQIKKNNLTAKVYHFVDEKSKTYEAVAYIPKNKIVMMFILGTRTPGNFTEKRQAFNQLIQSVVFISENVKVSEDALKKN